MSLVILDGAPQWSLSGASLDYDFANSRYYQAGGARNASSLITTSRATTATDLLPTSPSGASFDTFASNIPRITTGLGLLVFQSVTNFLLNSGVPATQTTGSLSNGVYTVWVNGSGSAVQLGGTATYTGAGTATQGSPNTITVTSPGTVTVTVVGSLNQFQLDNTSFGGPYVPTAGTTATCAADVVTVTTVPTIGSSLTLFGKGSPIAPTSFTTVQGLISVSDGTLSNRFSLFRNSSDGKASTLSETGGVATSLSTIAWSQATSGKLAAAVTTRAFITAFNNTNDNIGSPAAIGVGMNTIQIGLSGNGTASFNGYIQEIAIWPTTKQSITFMQQITE